MLYSEHASFIFGDYILAMHAFILMGRLEALDMHPL